MTGPPGIGFPRPLTESDQFYRAVPAVHLKPDGKISPGAFSNATGSNAFSVDWAVLSTPQDTLGRFLSWHGRRGVASVAALVFWKAGQSIKYTPIEGENEAHSDIIGSDAKSVRKQIAREAQLVHEVPF